VTPILLETGAKACAPPSGATEAYLSGVRLCFVQPMCVITQRLPSAIVVHAVDMRKRKQHALDVSADQL
jgi:hypothetical protein